jgi:branched-chain amino acid transport system ATP-binding protein
MLRIDELVVHYGRIAALQGVSLEVAEGEVVGVIGPNGAGKSTMLAAVMGLRRPTSGTIDFEGSSLVRRDRAAVDSDLEEMLERFPVLAKFHGSSAAKLSGGEQQQLAIARALLARPRLLLLDEPSLGLAPRMIDLVFETLDGLRQEGTTILLVEQNAARTAEFADRTYVLRSGRVRTTGSREELLDTADFVDAYLGV